MRRALLLLGMVGAMLLAPASATAHPLGNFTVNTYAGIELSPGAVRVDYVLDMAEIPTVQAMPALDADGDGTVSSAEGASWATDRASDLLAGVTLTVDGANVTLHVSGAHLELLPGQGGLGILRMEATFDGSTAARGELSFRDANDLDRIGWHEVTAAGVDGVALRGSSVPAASPSDRLRSYPRDLLSSPLDVREADLYFEPGRSVAVPSTTDAEGSSARPGVAGGAFADLVERTGPLMLVALLLAFAFGALHALGPGHGKTLMGAYLVGAGGRARVAVAVGGAVAVMHTASGLALGFVVMTATTVFAPERVYPWLGLASGLVALGLGAALLVSRLGSWGHGGPERAGAEDGHAHDPHDHPHGGHDHPHSHAPALPGPVLSSRGLTALAVAGGILPSPTALVVLLASVALHRVGYGLALIGAFSLGLAAALVAVGLLALRARHVVERRMSGRAARLMPIASAAAIVVVGLVLTVSGATKI